METQECPLGRRVNPALTPSNLAMAYMLGTLHGSQPLAHHGGPKMDRTTSVLGSPWRYVSKWSSPIAESRGSAFNGFPIYTDIWTITIMIMWCRWASPVAEPLGECTLRRGQRR